MKILIVDDIADNRLLLQAVLSMAGYDEVYEASSADEAFAWLGLAEGCAIGERPDLILMDVMMPGIDGVEATRRIKAVPELANVPVLMVTAKSEGSDLETAFAAGAMDYICKPFDATVLLARVHNALQLKQAMDARIAREKELARMLKQLQHDMDAAGRLQASMLPPISETLQHINYAYHYEPCAHVGGDHLNIFPLSATKTAMFLLDVSGHGMASALLSVTLNRHLADIRAGESLVVDEAGVVRAPDDVVTRLNEQYLMNTDHPMYFTMFYGVFDVESRVLEFVQAGHPSMIYVPQQGHIPEVCREGDMPVGMVEGATYQSQQLQLQSGDRLYVYSDALIEGDKAGELYGENRVLASVAAHCQESLDVSIGHIVDDCKQWLGSENLDDDLTLLAIDII